MADYSVTYERTSGPEYAADQRWTYIVWAGDDHVITGYARTKREAEQFAREDVADHAFETNHR